MAVKTILIRIDEQNKTIEVETEEGQTIFLQSLALFGGDAANKEVYIKLMGASADAAWAYGQGFKIAHGATGGKSLKNFYKQCAAHVCNIIDPNAFRQEAGALETLNRWECQDQTKWAGWDSEDVLADKELAESKRRRYN